jgi:hypothetical protein
MIKSKNLKFLSEKEGQIQFFKELKISDDIELTNNNDGIYKGTIFEFKLTISDINKVLFQALKYLSHLRVRGIPVPRQILLVALNEQIAYLFDSSEFLKYVEEIYAGSASKNNNDFSTKIKPEKIDYSSIRGLSRIIQILDTVEYTKVHIDVFDVVGWSEHFYRENPKASKSKLFEELRQPKQFKKYIYPWKGKDLDFKYINDLLNAKIIKKELGAFYTPQLYCLKAAQLVRKAIREIPKGNDYIILDRSAGTGNLEEFLTDKNVNDISIGELDKYVEDEIKIKYLRDKATIINTFYGDKNFNDITVGELEKHKTKVSMHDFLFDNELSHTIVNTYELKEWIVLYERLGDKVRHIIPPEIDPRDQLVNGGDALSEIFVMGSETKNSAKLKKEYFEIIDEVNNYIKDQSTNIILYENPPYRDSNSSHYNENIKQNKNDSFVKKKMQIDKLGDEARDISNQFIWSAWKYYLKKKDDSYILFSPIKYWKSLGLSNKKFIDGYLFNRGHFHASPSAISCILWKNSEENLEELILKVFDISQEKRENFSSSKLVKLDDIVIKKANSTLDIFSDNRKFESDIHTKCWSNSNGLEKVGKCEGKPVFNSNILGWLRVKGYSCDPMNTQLLRQMIYINRGFYLRSDNFIEKLPLFAAKLYPQKNWYEKDVYFTTADGGNRYIKDKTFLKQCFIFTCLSQKNHCRSFDGSDGKFYKNELCFDKKTISSEKLNDYRLTKEEQDLLDSFNDILKIAKTTYNYNKKYAYGTYQIDEELNTRHKSENDEWIYEYPQLNTAINGLKTKLSKYYEKNIQPKLFEYMLLK